MSFRLVPKTPETMAIILRIVAAPADQPIVEMNDETARNMGIIWRSIDVIATRWRGRSECRIPGQPMDRREMWGVFASDCKGEHQILPALVDFIGTGRGEGKVAIDLGCGESAAAALLLQRGWTVIAIDNSRPALEVFREMHSAEIASGQLRVIEADATEFTPSAPVDLVVAADVLPYLDPAQFRTTWTRVHDLFLKQKGIFVGSLFREATHPADLVNTNIMKEMGAWLLPDRRMVRPLLTAAGYEIRSCTFRKDPGIKEPFCMQFVAEKKA